MYAGILPWTDSLGAGQRGSFALGATETPWKGKRKFVLRPGLVSGNDECGGKSGGSLVQMDGLVIDYPEAAWLDFTCSVAA